MENTESIFNSLTGRRICLFLLSVFVTFALHAYNLRQLSSKDGLSNSAIQSICQDNDRFMWIGTVDGLNVYDGVDINIFKPGIDSSTPLSSNLIEEVREGEDGIIWINTNHGLNRYNKKTREIECYDQFEGKYYLAKTETNEIFVVHEDHTIAYYDKRNKQFASIPYPSLIKNNIQRVFIARSNVLWMVTNRGIIHRASISMSSAFPTITPLDDFRHECGVRYAFMEGSRVYFIDEKGFFFEIEMETQKKSLVMNLGKELEERGIVSSIVKDKEDYLVAFQTNGLIRLQNTPENLLKYKVENIDIYCGVFCLYKDKKQDIVWIGTDGQGVYMYTRDLFSIRSVTFEHLQYSIQKPVRALFWDRERNLWIGTKDDGILLVKDYRVEENIRSKEVSHITTFNSSLTNNSIYAFGKSRRNLLWIGGDGPGLNYYSYKYKTVRRLESHDTEPILFVHAICEVNDSTLWLASVGAGIYKVIVGGSTDEPSVKSVKRFTFGKDDMSYNYFFAACQESDSVLWFGNRGYGLRRLSLGREVFDEVRLYKKNIRTINDILSLYQDSRGNLWAGTSFGVLKLLHYNTAEGKAAFDNYNEIEGLPNNTIHGILEDNRGDLWVSTNGGVVRFDREEENFHVYNRKTGLNVFEFSDGAYLKDERTGVLFFGGTNGFVTISPDIHETEEFVPELFFTGLRIYEKEYNLNDFLSTYNNKEYLQLRHDQNFFSLSFIALDYINGQNCKYFYKLGGANTQWIDNGYSNVVNFTNITPGEYTLQVKCNNGNLTTDVRSLVLVVLPPWYMTKWAYGGYVLLLAAVVFAGVQLVRRRYRRKRESIIEKMNQQQKEEIYESKLRFFTNITHEFSTPLTLIYGPCDRIIAYEKSDNFIRKYAGVIKKNTERLNSLIQELIEFRRIETGHKACVIERLDISALVREIADSFAELAETRSIEYTAEVEPELSWNSDKGCLTTILTNLLSNAFKYTPEGGKIKVAVRPAPGGVLEMTISNTGKGINKEDIPYIFDRYRVLENLEMQTQRGFFSRNGLGLAICYNLVKLLEGEINVSSVPDEFTEFRVTLPEKEMVEAKDENVRRETSVQPLSVPVEQPVAEMESVSRERAKPAIFVVDDDAEMRWFVSETLNKHYHVIGVDDPLAVPALLESEQPQLIISDIMMPGIDGITLLKQLKADRRTAHIPFVLLSAKNTPEEQTEGIAAGAEAYIVKPFNVGYLQSLVERLIQRQSDLKDYYRSPISAFEFADGRFIHKENKEFFQKIVSVIDRNFSNADFATEELAKELGLSSRQLYRKLKEITDETPATLIKEYRLAVVEKLLLTTQHSVDEIMYKAGFNHRGSFYRLFSLKYGMTPGKYRESKTEGME